MEITDRKLEDKVEAHVCPKFPRLRHAASAVRPEHAAIVHDLTNFVYTAFVGILNEWLATRDTGRLHPTTGDLIEGTQRMASDRLAKPRRHPAAAQ